VFRHPSSRARQWDRLRMLRELLDNSLEDGLPIPRDLLNDGLHAALCLNRPEAAVMLFDAGADTSHYNFRLESAAGSDNGVVDVTSSRPLDSGKAWTEVLQAAAADTNAPYLAKLIEEAKRSMDKEAKEMTVDRYSGDRGAAWRACRIRLKKLGAVDGVSVDAELFMLLLLANRPGLAKLLWSRDAKGREDHALRTALVACALCSSLAMLPEVRDHHTLDMLRQGGYLGWGWGGRGGSTRNDDGRDRAEREGKKLEPSSSDLGVCTCFGIGACDTVCVGLGHWTGRRLRSTSLSRRGCCSGRRGRARRSPSPG
jgi:hypothetical protein